uniref:Chromodomain helicase DNA binding protein 7 n=1 Tax=Lepisosteus oculatus TaxID=7918 RepID=W5MCL6_LEPOC
MADPGMMSLFGDDGNLFTEGLEGLGECGYSESQVNPLGQQMPIDQGYGSLPSSLHHTSQAAPGQGQPKLSHFDHFGQYEQPKMHLIEQQGGRMLGSAPGNGMSSPHSQYHNPPPPVSHGGGGQIGVYPGMQGERHGQPFVDSGSMWGPRAVQVPEQVRAPFQQQQQQAPPQQSGPSGPQGHVQQMGPYMARGDYTMQQHSQTPTPPRMNQFSQGPPQEGSRGPPANHFLGHMAPQQNPNLVGPPMRHSVQPQQPQQFHHRPPPGAILPESVAHSPRFSPSPSQQQQQQAVAGGRPQQNLGFSSRSQPVPSPTVNNSGQYPPYSPYSNLNQGLVNNTGMSPNMSLTSSSAPMNQGPVVPRYPSAGVGYPPGGPQGLMHQQPIHVNQINSQPMHPSQQQGSYGSPPPMSPMKAMSNPAGTPPPQQVRPGSAGMGMEVGGYPSMPHQPAGALGLSQRNMGPRGLTQQQQQQPPPPPQPYMGLSPSQRDLAGSLRPPGGLGGGHAEPQVLQDQRLLSGQQQPPQQQQQQPQALLSVHRQSSPPHPHHQPWAQQHQSPPTPQKVPVQQPSPSDPSLDLPASDKTHAAGPNSQLATCDEQQAGGDQKQKKKKKKKVKASPGEGGGEAGPEGCVDPLKNPAAEQPEEKKKKKKPKEKKEPKEPKPPKTPKTPKTPKEPKEKKVKTTTPKAKSTPKVSVKKPDPETSTTKKKEGKRKRESSDNSDLEKTPPPSPEEEEDLGVQKRRSSRQVKRKRYTEDLELIKIGKSSENAEYGKLYWPTASALTTRLRRLITAYQRSYKREQMRQEALNKTDRRRRRPREEVRALEAEREAIITERRQKWTRREEADFYRVVSTFGVMFDTKKHRFDWNQFRAFARLDKKTDESLEKYFYSFVAMCRRVCRMPVKSDEEPHDPTILIEPITEERASRTLYRIELLRKIREQVLTHPDLDERLKLCQASLDLPEWWESGRHDKDLLVGASKHGVSRTDYHILNDPELSFLESHRRFAQNKSSGQLCSTPYPGQGTLLALSAAALPVKKEEEQEPHPPPAEGAEALEEEPKAEVDPLKASEEEEAKEDVRTSAGEEVPVKPEESEGAPTETQCDAKEPAVQEDAEALAELEPKSLSEKGSEEDDEDKMDDDDKSEESSHAEAGAASRGKNFDEESNASMSTARDETRDGFYAEDGETSMAHILHERSFSFSFWPKDRVMINRLDNICEAVLKGKWPVNRRQLFDFPGLLPGYTPSTLDSPLPRRSFAELSMVGQANYSGSEDITLSPQISKEEVLSMTVPRQRRRRRRKIEIEAERAAKRKNLMEMVAQLRESHVGSDSPDKAVDLSKALREATSSTSNISSVASKFLLPNASTPTADAFKTQMELLQAGLSGTPTRQLMNGSFLEGEIPMKRRRGRRKNVEGLDLLFMSNKRASLSAEDAEVTKAFEDRVQVPQQPQRNIPSPGQLDPNARIPVINLEDGSRLVGDEAPTNKDLIEWLKQHPAYTVDMPSYVPKNEDLLLSPFQKPKQKRHRCRNPNKIDINTLTGEERVPVVNRRNGKKMGGAMAPPMKDLPRWLEENPEFAIAPDWTEIVKQSGFLPESMYDRLLTGPVVREEGPGRRGRRPKSEIAKAAAQAAAAAASSSGINPLLMNSLFAGMDLTSLQNLQNLQSLQLAGLMGFPPGLATGAGGDAKHTSAMLPLMLPGMAGLPNMFGLGGLFNNNLAAAAAAASGSPSAAGQGEPEEGAAPKPEENNDEEGDEKESEKAEASGEGEGSASAASAAAAAAAAAGMSAGPLAFNPFLLSTMAPGLFYPSMFLPPSLGGLTLPGFSQATLAGLQNAMAGASGGAAEDGDNTMEDSDTDESQNKTADSSVLEDEVGPAEELDSLDGGEDGEENENDD